jgi:hypothetical protein
MIIAQAAAAAAPGNDAGPNLLVIGLLVIGIAAVVIVPVLLLLSLFGSRKDSDRE